MPVSGVASGGNASIGFFSLTDCFLRTDIKKSIQAAARFNALEIVAGKFNGRNLAALKSPGQFGDGDKSFFHG